MVTELRRRIYRVERRGEIVRWRLMRWLLRIEVWLKWRLFHHPLQSGTFVTPGCTCPWVLGNRIGQGEYTMIGREEGCMKRCTDFLGLNCYIVREEYYYLSIGVGTALFGVL